MNLSGMSKPCLMLVLASALAGWSASSARLQAANLIPSPGVEEEKGGAPSGWKFGCRRREAEGEWIGTGVKTGDRTLRITIDQYTPPTEALCCFVRKEQL